MKKIILAMLLLPCVASAQVKTEITYTIPAGVTSAVSFCTSESDAPVLQENVTAGTHTITLETSAPATGFLYLAATKKLIPFNLTGTASDLSKRLGFPNPGEEDATGASAEDVFPTVLQRFLNVTSSLKSLGFVPDVVSDSSAATAKVKQYYHNLQSMASFADSVVSQYPNNNASLFTVFRLAHWCSYSPEVYTILNKLDKALLKSDFAKELEARKQQIEKDSLEVVGKKPGLGLQMVINSTTIGAGARKKLMIYWNEYSHIDADLIEDLRRLHLLFSNKQLQVNFVYTGDNKNWLPMIKKQGMPAFANYVHCNKADQLGNSPVLAGSDNAGVIAGLRGYNLYRKLNID